MMAGLVVGRSKCRWTGKFFVAVGAAVLRGTLHVITAIATRDHVEQSICGDGQWQRTGNLLSSCCLSVTCQFCREAETSLQLTFTSNISTEPL